MLNQAIDALTDQMASRYGDNIKQEYKQLVKHHHPDISPFCPEEAQARFTYIRKLYQLTRKCWEQLKPTAVISQETLQHRLQARVPYSPESFWYWLD